MMPLSPLPPSGDAGAPDGPVPGEPGGTRGPLPEELPPGANDGPGESPDGVAVPGGITMPLSPLPPSGAGAPADGPVPGEPGGPGIVGLMLSGEEGGNAGGVCPGGATVPGWNSAVSSTVDCRIGSVSMVNGTDRSLSGYGGMLLSVLTALVTSS